MTRALVLPSVLSGTGARCGTANGRADHLAAGEEVCRDCLDASARYATFLRRRMLVGLPTRRQPDPPSWVETMPDFPAVGTVLRAGFLMGA